MKAFSFLSILKNFGKQLSSLASQMPWCNLRFNLGSMSVLSRVSRPFSRTSFGVSLSTSFGTSRRASHFAAILTILFTIGVGGVSAQETVLFSTDFSTWSDETETISAGSTKSGVYFKSNTTIKKDAGMTFAGNASTSANYIAIPLSNINTSITVTVTFSSSRPQWKNAFTGYSSQPTEEQIKKSPSSVSDNTRPSSATETSSWTIETAYTNGVFYIGKGSNNSVALKSLTITTPSSAGSVAVTGVSLNKPSTTLEIGGTETLTATISPDNATNKNVTWSSDATLVATVDEDGLVTAVAAGTATITVTTEDGSKTATCVVTVNAASGGDDSGDSGDGVGESVQLGLENELSSSKNSGGPETYISVSNAATSALRSIGTYLEEKTDGSTAVKYASDSKYTETLYRIKSSSSTFLEYVGFQVKIADGYKLNITSLNAYITTTANLSWKVTIENNEGNVIYDSKSMTITNYDKETPTNVSLSESLVLNELTGTIKVKAYAYYSSSGKYFCFPFLKIGGTIEALPTCTSPDISYSTASVTKTSGNAAFTNALTAPTGLAVDYESSNANVATVAANGQVTIVGAGTTTITASSAEQTVSGTLYCADEASYTLTVSKANISPTLVYSNTSLDIDGTATPTLTGNTGNGTVIYSSNNTDVATVDENTGVVTAVGAGTATITATIAATANYNSGTATATITVNAAQEPETYSITYECDGATSDCPSNATEQTVLPNPLPTPVKTGYTFVGWYTDAEKTIQAGAGATLTADITLYAKWNANTNTAYTVKHYKQQLDGTYSATPDDTDNLTGTTAASVTPAVKSYEGFTAPSTQTVTIAADGSTVVTYQYTRNSYTLTWDVNGGNTLTGDYTTGTVAYGTTITKPADPTRTGYTFAGWSPTVAATMPAENTTYTATFTATPIETPEPSGEICWDPANNNDDKLSSGSTDLSKLTGKFGNGIEITIPNIGTDGTGYCSGADDASGSGYLKVKNAQENSIIIITTNKEVNITIGGEKYNDNTGSFYLVKSTDTSTKLAECNTGNTATATNCAAGTYHIYAKAEKKSINFSKLCIEPTTPEPTKYNVTTTLTNVTANSEFPATITADGSIERTITASDGYTLPSDITVTGANYTWDASTGALTITNATDNVTITIVGVENTPIIPDPEDLYTVTFDTNGGSEVSPITQASAGAPITLPTPTKDGYELVGWYIGGGLVTDDTYTPTADITATAAWKENCILGTGGEDNTTHSTTFVGSSSAIGNWSGNSNLGSTQFADNTTNCLKLKTNGTLTYTFPDVVTLKSVQLKMAFANDQEDLPWSLTVKDASDTQLIKKDVITNMIESKVPENFDISLEYNNVKKVTLTNDSEKDLLVGSITFTIVISSGSGECYYVTYNGNGADGGSVNDANAYAANEEVTTLANGFTRAGYTFTGWNTAAGGTDISYAAGGTFTITGNTELFAQWKENTDVELGDCTATTITYNLLTPNNTTPSQTVSPAGIITELTGATAQGTATTNTGGINSSFSDYSVRYEASEGSDNAENGVTFTFTVPTGYVFKPSAITTNLMCYGKGKNGDTQNYEFYGTLSDGATTIYGTALPGTADGANADIEYSDITNKKLSGTVTLRLNAVKVGGSNQSFRIKSPITIEGELCSAQTYTITYNKNGGSGDMESTNNVVAENEFTREGYTFDGWNTKTDGTGTSYAAGEIVASNLTLYAQWRCIEPKFTVSYEETEYTINDEASAITVTVTEGNSGGVTYQWYSSTTNDRNNGNTIGGATSASYTPSTTSVGTTYYWCEIENTCTSVQTAMIAITVSANKNTPSVTWNWFDAAETEKGTINYGGGNYTIAAQITSDGWGGTLTADMLTAPTGINLYNVLVQDKTISATFDVTTSFDRVANPTTIPFYLSLPETDDYYSLVSEGDVTYEACTTGGGSGEVILEADGENKLKTWENGNFSVTCNTKNGAQKTYVKPSANDTFEFSTTGGETILSVDIYHSASTNLSSPMITRITAPSTTSNSSYFTVSTENNKIIVTATNQCYVFKTVITYTSGNGKDVSLTWDTEDDLTNQVEKTQSDPNFTYTASLTGDNSNTLGTITYSSSNPECAIVNPTTGEVEITATGTETLTTTITATLAPSGCYQGATATYTISVAGMECNISAGTLELTTGAENKCSGESVTLTLTGYTAAGTTLQWYKGDAAINGATAVTYTTAEPGAYSVLVTDNNNNLCAKRSNTITITNISAEASVTNIVNTWYIKNGRLTPEIALWKLEEGTTFESVTASDGWAEGTGFDDGKGANAFSVKDGVVYLTGTPPKENTGEDKAYTLTLNVEDVCKKEYEMTSSTITIVHQKNTDKHVLAFVVTGKENGGFVKDSIPAAQTTLVPLYNTISDNFEVLATNIYATDNEQLLKEYYSQFDIICITDYPNTQKKGVNGKSYTDAMGSLIDIRPILSMEAWVSKYTNWNNKGVTGDPKSPTTRQYSMLLQCKDHEIFAGTSLVDTLVGDETMYRVTMVDKNKEEYVNLDMNTAGTDSYDHDGKPALQGFTYTSAMSSMLPIGIIDDGDGNNLQVGLERQHEIEARMMVIGVNSYAMERLTGDGQTVIINALNYLMKKNAEDISDCSIYFDNNKGEGDGLWSSPVNWGPSRNSLPQSSQEARILAPCVVSDYTAKVASVKIVTDGTYKYQSMDGTASGSLTIAPNGALVVKGRIQAATAPNYLETRNTDVEDLMVQSDATGNGALIHGEIGEAIGATVELLSKAYSVREFNESTGKYKKKKYWQYVALPVQNALAEDAFWGAYTYQYDETQGWIKKGTGENIEEFWGIGLSIDNEVYSGANNETSLTKFTIKGNLALATDRDIDLTRTTNAGEGQNMIGNSWTAPIHLTSMTEDDFENAVATVYIYNTGRDEQVPGSEGIASSANGSTQAGQWISIPVAATKLEPWQGPKVIPSMQAFEVDLDEGKTSGVLHLNYDKHVRTIATPEEENLPLRAPKYLGNEPSMIRLRVADSITYTDLYLIEGDQFTDEFDNAWDGKYQPCDGRSATLYAMSPIGDMAVLAQPSVNNTSVVFEPGKKSEYVFTFGYNGDVTYYLNDMQLKTSTEIKEGNEYRFTYNKGDMKNRFLVTRESFDSPNISTGLANIVTDGNGLQVTNPNQENLQVILIDAAGRMCSIYNTAEPMFKVELPATQGVYMINVKGETTNIVRKVVK